MGIEDRGAISGFLTQNAGRKTTSSDSYLEARIA